jgi:hypothetical protein
MEAKINKVEFSKEFESKFGTLYSFKVSYNDKYGFYSSKKREQTAFKEGEICEFIEEIKKTDKGEFTIIKPVNKQNQQFYNKAIKKEQSKYSGFAASYVKDLILVGMVKYENWESESTKVFNWMVKLDKTLES